MTYTTPQPAIVRYLTENRTQAELNTIIEGLMASLASGNTSLTLPGLSGTIDLATQQQTLTNYLAAKETLQTATDTTAAIRHAPGPMGHTLAITGATEL